MSAYTCSLSRLLGGKEADLPRERYQEPVLQQTKRGVWFIRPWVDVVDTRGNLRRAKKTISIGAMGKREAQAKSREIMQTINRADYVITSQIRFGRFVEEYIKLHVERQDASTQAKYRSHLKNHILPAFKNLMLCELTPLLAQRWLDAKGEGADGAAGLSWATRTDLRNILSSIFTKAIEWGRWKDGNPIAHVHAGRKRAAREQRKLTLEQTQRFLAALPADVRLMCCVGLFCTLRVSEILGLQEKHLDFARNLILVRQKIWRGHLGEVKNDKSRRDVPMGYLGPDLQRMCTGNGERYVFQVQTRPEWGRKESTCRDSSDLLQHFLRPAAKALGFYWKGFGWHSLRREAVTELSPLLGPHAAQRLAGHSTADMSLHYTLADAEKQDAAIRQLQERIIGKTGEKVQ